MGCDGPDPPEDNANDLIPPPRHELIINGNGEDSEDERNEHFGYEPLPQGPDGGQFDDDQSDDDSETNQSVPDNMTPIESMDAVITREVWNAPHNSESIQMDNEQAEQVMSAMANFMLPRTSIPEWAQSISEEQWKQTLKEKIETLKSTGS